ncbi:type IV pilus modification protein PilV [Massilia pseudoviolaceinigra]|uniref:type IV pilus modification protein PilV n=1 Tax=Massilia pseudoviolaceinigra TaxID=3057165 RepID=UPI002796593F|nr:type IV pilus modification protein PilV [Massilia sp. CCM 9206]MDQ1920652.1 type IV pilus modification protein PilV [Massilia sp. CCM 9206]
MRRQQGFSMLEVLITMIVISVGLLGIAGLIITNMKANHSAYSRGQATILAMDIIDRMRANRTVAQAGAPYIIDVEAPTPAAVATVGDRDIREWRMALASAIKEGTGGVAFDASGNVTVTIQWNDTRATGDGATIGLKKQQFVQETRL